MPMLSIPDATYAQLTLRARQQNVTVSELAVRLLQEEKETLLVELDTDYLAECNAEKAAVPTLQEIRALTAHLPSLSATLIAEREER